MLKLRSNLPEPTHWGVLIADGHVTEHRAAAAVAPYLKGTFAPGQRIGTLFDQLDRGSVFGEDGKIVHQYCCPAIFSRATVRSPTSPLVDSLSNSNFCITSDIPPAALPMPEI